MHCSSKSLPSVLILLTLLSAISLIINVSLGMILQRNYRFFFMFVFSTTLLCAYVLAFCCVYIRKIKESEDITIWKAMLKTPASMALILYTFITVWFVGGLTCFHIYLISTNQVKPNHLPLSLNLNLYPRFV